MQATNLNFEMVRGSDVELTPVTNYTKGEEKIVGVKLDVQGYRHEFDRNSGLVRQLKAVTTDELQDRLSGGNYFFVNGRLMDFRAGDYEGFIQSDAGISNLMQHLGAMERKRGHFTRSVTPGFNREQVLGRAWEKQEFHVPGMKEGGAFNSTVSFMWNPFYRDIHTHVGVERLICDNGMVATADVMNYTVPMVNDWREGLEIAHRRLTNKLESTLVGGLENTTTHRASVATVALLNDHITNRMKAAVNFGNMSDAEASAKLRERNRRLLELGELTDVKRQLGQQYTTKVFEDRSIGKMLPSHLTAFDAFNIATELSSHTNESQHSSNSALNGIANGIVFQNSELKSQHAFVDTPRLSDFNDHDQAFMGAGLIAVN